MKDDQCYLSDQKSHTEIEAMTCLEKRKNEKKHSLAHLFSRFVMAVWSKTSPGQELHGLILSLSRHPVPGIARHLMPPQVDPNEMWQSWDQYSLSFTEGLFTRLHWDQTQWKKHIFTAKRCRPRTVQSIRLLVTESLMVAGDTGGSKGKQWLRKWSATPQGEI